MKNQTSLIAFSCFFLFAGIVEQSCGLTIQLSGGVPSRPVDAMLRGGELLADAPRFFDQLGYSWRWDESVQQLSCVKGPARFVFSPDIPHYTGPAGLSPMSAVPVVVGHSLYVPVSALLEIMPSLGDGPVGWDSTRQIVTVDRTSFSVASVTTETKENVTVITIGLNDPVGFESAHIHPRLSIVFPRATIDTGRIRQIKKTGCVDSLSAVQSGESARIIVSLSREVEEPKIDYIEDRRIVLVILRPRPAPSASVKASRDEAGATITTIVIDPGHGGKDPGAIGPGGTMEKDVVLKLALHLRDLFKKHKDIKVFLTRDRDVFVPLADRTKMANRQHADLFVSLHANATAGSKKKKETTAGYKVYFLSQAKNEEDKLAAMRENAVIELEEKPQDYSALQNVLIDLAGNEYQRESQELSIFIDQRFEATFKKAISRQATGIGQANFWVLNGAYMPSILIETGFISNRSEEKLLRSDQMQKRMAAAIYQALTEFKKKYETGL